MKLQAIKRLCLQAKRFVIENTPNGAQWISDEVNHWPIVGIRIRESYIEDVFGLKEKQAKKCIFRAVTRTEQFFREGYTPMTTSMRALGTVWDYEQPLMALDGDFGVMYIQQALLEPVMLLDGETEYHLHLDDQGNALVGVWRGVFCDALVAPISADLARRTSAFLQDIGLRPVFETGRTEGGDGDEEGAVVEMRR